MSELEDKVLELTGRISALMSDKAALDSRIGILNRVLRMREEHIEMLQRKVRPYTSTVTCSQLLPVSGQCFLQLDQQALPCSAPPASTWASKQQS